VSAQERKNLIDRIVPEAHSIGLFRPILRSRRRLQVSAAAIISGQCILLWAVGYLVENYSRSAGLNIIVIACLSATLLATGYVLALVLGDLFFPGPWREKMYHGESFVPTKFEEQAALLKNHGIYFIILWVLCSIGGTLAIDYVTGGFLARYQRTGSVLTMMKSELESDRLNALDIFASPLSSRRWEQPELRAQNLIMLSDESTEVRAMSAYVAGRISNAEASEILISLLNDDDDAVRSEASIALGRLQWLAARSELLATLKRDFEEKNYETASNILYALSLLGDKSVATPVQGYLERCYNTQCDTVFLAYAFYLLKTLQASSSVNISIKFLTKEDATNELRCYAADALRYTAKPRDIPMLKEQFELAAPMQECAPFYKKHHSEAAVLLFDSEPLRAKLLRAVGNQKDTRQYDWIWRVGSNTAEHPQTRKAAEIYTRAMIGQ
jgi:hypothetical protein